LISSLSKRQRRIYGRRVEKEFSHMNDHPEEIRIRWYLRITFAALVLFAAGLVGLVNTIF
jgi:hypothetical protein